MGESPTPQTQARGMMTIIFRVGRMPPSRASQVPETSPSFLLTEKVIICYVFDVSNHSYLEVSNHSHSEMLDEKER
ncbi:MAG: hypothetical protein AUH89_05890 [Ktedonobacter sp. 13_1_40CM_4_52_4]|nr:MAG: hypothetical protein AUH89_05890 [Ktedonobacter sp. 13_1_40CM_4_52_4]